MDGAHEWAGPIVQGIVALIGAGGLAALAKIWVVDRRRLQIEEDDAVNRRQQEITERLTADAETYRDLYHAERGRREELLEQLAEERSRAARLERRIERMETSLETLSVSTGDWHP